MKSMGKIEDKDNKKQEKFYLLFGLMRKKDNPDIVIDKKVCRQIIRDYDLDLQILKLRMDFMEKGVWRIYKTINARDIKKAYKELHLGIVKEEKDFSDKIDSFWKTCLMQPKCKAERNILIDIDSKDVKIVDLVRCTLYENKKWKNQFNVTQTPNGYHIVVKEIIHESGNNEVFDIRIIQEILDKYSNEIEIKRDALQFIKLYDNRDIL